MGADLKDRIEKVDYIVTRTNFSKTHEHPMTSIINAVLGILMALGVLIVFLSSSLIANTLSALLNQHMRHIGVIKLVGGRNRQVLGMYMVLILVFGVLALLIAVPLGGQGAYGLAAFIADKMSFTLLGYRIVPMAFAIQIAVGLLVPLVAGLAPVLGGARVTVLRAISGDMTMDEKQADESPGREIPVGEIPNSCDKRSGAARYPHPASVVDFITKHIPSPRTPAPDPVHIDNGWRDLHCGVQCARVIA